VRELETYFNTAIVRSVFNRLGAVPAEYSAADMYEIFSAADANVADETFLRTWLDERGVDSDELAADFLSYQLTYNHLREERSVESPATREYTPEERKQQAIERMGRLKRRAKKVCKKWLSVLQWVDMLPDRELPVRIVFQVECPEYGTRSSIMTYMYHKRKRRGSENSPGKEFFQRVDKRVDKDRQAGLKAVPERRDGVTWRLALTLRGVPVALSRLLLVCLGRVWRGCCRG